ncbi:hypothetical protein TL16_g12516 [Triparma laevis f. inornata]|uniref:Fe2OG dioxygenase domain-containing protein n=1 Tax=Triparma laevis f. inornata TaxID=1714386 RepID=A0A9W7BS37_9STRA|nr:hypothetical protein TL16_g12516 [Triparma laevis f. inornata]
MPAPTQQIIITKSAISSGVTPSSLPPNLLVHSLDEPYSHVHLIVQNKKKKFTQRQLDELSLELAVTLDDTIPNDKSVLITASNIDPNNKPIDPKSIIKKARTKHLKTHSLDTPMNTLPWPSSSPFSLSACKIVEHASIDKSPTDDDTSEIVSIDGLVCSSLRSSLLDLLSPSDVEKREKKIDSIFWKKGAYDDVAGEDGKGYGLNDEMMIALNSDNVEPSAITELGRRVKGYLEDVNDGCPIRLTKLPSSVFGPHVAPLGGNAPTHSDGSTFDWHIDGDPSLTPPGAFRDYYGLYNNRVGGDKPRFVSALVYLNEDWKEEWEGGTEFLDLPSEETYKTRVKPGRVVLLDSDITHRVTTPNKLAGEDRPRYSIVLKLLIRKERKTKKSEDNVVVLARKTPDDKYIGSAKA